MILRRTGPQGQRGYSLAEMVVVVAIIGIFSLVAVPQFMNMNRSMKTKASMRQFASDIRGVRQRAISRNRRTAITMVVGNVPGQRTEYEIWERNDAGTWIRIGSPKRLIQETSDLIYFQSTDFANAVDGGNDVGGDTKPDIVFLPNGTVQNMPGANPTVVLKTDWKIAKHTFTYQFTGSGNFVTTSN
jgi:prepilin-type N-terminal cleavage/methylation domain-containing protein